MLSLSITGLQVSAWFYLSITKLAKTISSSGPTFPCTKPKGRGAIISDFIRELESRLELFSTDSHDGCRVVIRRRTEFCINNIIERLVLALSDYSHIENHRHKPALCAFRSSIFSTCRIAVVREASQP